MFREEDTVIDIGDRAIIVDKAGYELWMKHKWRYNLSIRHLHRNKLIGIKNGKGVYRIVLFWVELLGNPKPRRVYFENQNQLDLRRDNIIIPYI